MTPKRRLVCLHFLGTWPTVCFVLAHTYKFCRNSLGYSLNNGFWGKGQYIFGRSGSEFFYSDGYQVAHLLNRNLLPRYTFCCRPARKATKNDICRLLGEEVESYELDRSGEQGMGGGVMWVWWLPANLPMGILLSISLAFLGSDQPMRPMSVITTVGLIEFTRILCGASSRAMALVMESRAPLEALYTVWFIKAAYNISITSTRVVRKVTYVSL